MLAVARDSKEIFIGVVTGNKSYQRDLADGWAANLVSVDFIKDANGSPKAFARVLLSADLQERLKVARTTITDLQDYQDEIVTKMDCLQCSNIDEVNDEALAIIAALYDLNTQSKQRVLKVIQDEFINTAQLPTK